MNHKAYHEKAFTYLTALCGVKSNRRTGSPGNREATEFFAGVAGQMDYLKRYGSELVEVSQALASFINSQPMRDEI